MAIKEINQLSKKVEECGQRSFKIEQLLILCSTVTRLTSTIKLKNYLPQPINLYLVNRVLSFSAITMKNCRVMNCLLDLTVAQQIKIT